MQLPPRLNRRLSPRIKLQGRVYLHDENRLFIAPIGDISAGGVYLAGCNQLPVGQPVFLVIKSAVFSQSLQIQGRVVRIDRGMAVQFNMPDGNLVRILESIDLSDDSARTSMKLAY